MTMLRVLLTLIILVMVGCEAYDFIKTANESHAVVCSIIIGVLLFGSGIGGVWDNNK